MLTRFLSLFSRKPANKITSENQKIVPEVILKKKSNYHLTGNMYDAWEISLHRHGAVTVVARFDIWEEIKKINITPEHKKWTPIRAMCYSHARRKAETALTNLNNNE